MAVPVGLLGSISSAHVLAFGLVFRAGARKQWNVWRFKTEISLLLIPAFIIGPLLPLTLTFPSEAAAAGSLSTACNGAPPSRVYGGLAVERLLYEDGPLLERPTSLGACER